MIQTGVRKKGSAFSIYKFTVLSGGVFGAIYFIIQFGTAVLDPSFDAWLLHSNDLEGISDLTQHYLGWRFYRKSPWSFPIGLIHGLSPEPISIVYTDSIPLFAVFFKLLSPLLPETFQYFGIFELISYILTGIFGALIGIKTLGKRKMYAVSAFIFLLTPVLLKRAFYHTALSAHFLILAAILLFMSKDDVKHIKRDWIILILISFLINPYYTPMTFIIMALSFLRDILWKHYKKKDMKGDIKDFLIIASASVLLSLFSGALLGMFYGDVSKSAENICDVSFNLNQLINPSDPTLMHGANDPYLYYFDGKKNTSLFLPELPLYTYWQHEGYAYLTLPLIILFISAIIISISNIFRKEKRNQRTYYQKSTAITLIIGTLIFLFLALSPRGTLGKAALYHIRWGSMIYSMLSVFRTAGRFIWVIYYAIITFSLLILGEALKNRGSTPIQVARRKNNAVFLILLIIIAFEATDLFPMIERKHEIYSGIKTVEAGSPYINHLDRDEVLSSLTYLDEIIFVSPTEAIRLRPYWSTVFEGYALSHDMKMNAAYQSRNTSKQSDLYADNEMENKNALYVFLNDDILKLHLTEKADISGMEIYPFEGIYIGYYK